MKYRAIIFDLDGTLLDTLEDIADSMNSMLSHYGFPEHDLDSYRYFVGEGVEMLVRRSLPEDKLDKGFIDQCISKMKEEYGKRWANKTRPYPGIPAMLDALTRRGILMAVLSNKPEEFTKLVIASLLPQWHFHSIIGSNSSFPKKPDPTTALMIAQAANIPPSEFIFLGDSGTDMKTAVNARMHPVGALWGFRTADELTASGAQALLEHPGDLLKLL
jgi:phosphoglycolate phosphatase